MRTALLSGLLAATLLPFATSATAAPLESVPELDLQRYAGTWHEIARLPMEEQEDCIADVTAHYRLETDGSIVVRNTCRTEDGNSEAVGEARRVEGHPGRLEVRFAPGWLSWLPNVWGDYWVIGLDPDYRWAVVGEPERRYLWLLSRTPTVPRAQFEQMKAVATEQGYDLSRLRSSGDTVDGG